MTKTFKVLSLLLTYPDKGIAEAANEFASILDGEDLLPAKQRKALGRLCSEIANRDLYDNQERYVLLFDRSRSLSLNIFEHVHGESRDRGQAMVDLTQLYESHGLELSVKELPDHLPLFLEFLSTLPLDEARGLLSDTVHIITALKMRLRKRKSPYASVFWALETLSEGKAVRARVDEILSEPDDDPADLEALDKIWEDEAVTFGSGPGPNAAAECGPDRLAAQMRAGMRPPPDTQTGKEV